MVRDHSLRGVISVESLRPLVGKILLPIVAEFWQELQSHYALRSHRRWLRDEQHQRGATPRVFPGGPERQLLRLTRHSPHPQQFHCVRIATRYRNFQLSLWLFLEHRFSPLLARRLCEFQPYTRLLALRRRAANISSRSPTGSRNSATISFFALAVLDGKATARYHLPSPRVTSISRGEPS